MSRMEKIVREIYLHKLVQDKDENIGKCAYKLNLQELFDCISIPENFAEKFIGKVK